MVAHVGTHFLTLLCSTLPPVNATTRALEAREDLQAADAAGGDGGAAVDQTPQGHKRDKPFTPSPDSKQAEDAENKVRMGKRVKEAAAGDNTAG